MKKNGLEKEPASQEKIIYGATALEDFLERSYISLVSFRSSYGLPIKPRFDPIKGTTVPSLSMSEFRAWCIEWKVDPEHPKTIEGRNLNRLHHRRRIEAMPDFELKSLDEIVQFTDRSTLVIMDWVRLYDGCPIKKAPGAGQKLSVSARDLRLWAFENGIGIVYRPSLPPVQSKISRRESYELPTRRYS